MKKKRKRSQTNKKRKKREKKEKKREKEKGWKKVSPKIQAISSPLYLRREPRV